MSQNLLNPPDNNELTIEIPVWVQGKRKWVTGITKKTTFDDLIYALLAQADLLKTSGLSNASSIVPNGYAIAECLQVSASATSNSHESEPPSLLTQRIIKGRGRVMKSYKSWQFDKYPLTVLHLIPTNVNSENNSSTMKLRSKIFRRFLSSKSVPLPPSSATAAAATTPTTTVMTSSQSDSSLISIGNGNIGASSTRQKSFNDFHENLNIIERQKRLLEYLDEKIHEAEMINSPVHNLPKSSSIHGENSLCEVTLNDVSRLFSHQIEQEDQLIFATQLCNSILNMQERLEEKTNVLYAVEQAISNELNQVLHQQHYDTLTNSISLCNNSSENNPALSNDLISLKNSIYRSRELSRIQSKEMHDLDLSLREIEIVLAAKYDEVRSLEFESSTTNRSSIVHSLSLNNSSRNHLDETNNYETFDLPTSSNHLVFTSIKEADEDSGINSLTSDDSNHHSMILTHQKLSSQTSQLETLV